MGLGIVILLAVLLLLQFPPEKTSSTGRELRMRACPVCGKELKEGENLLAERTGVVKDGRERIVIKGCPYCLGPPGGSAG
ncbi:MAG: hypothetical protein D6679_13190 [Candidatus Hydrogenedentota bacterium]|nr:MAG: hypothetical protein D6679_13190 [Candidatus Hydrogenedentota bacterium]